MKVDSKSNKLTVRFSTGMLMRVESEETFEKRHREKKLAFGYATNWGDYTKGGRYVIEIIFTVSCDKKEYMNHV